MGSNKAIDELTKLLGVTGANGAGWASGRLMSIGERLQNLRALNDSVAERTRAAVIEADSSAGSSSGGSVGGIFVSTLGHLFGGGMGIAPLFSGLAGLFTGGGAQASAAEPAMRYMKPLPIQLEAGISSAANGAFAVDAAQGNAARAMAGAQITVQVQAMDSRSFLDRSQDIAAAVRQAMLETTILNDVIREV
jgi:hypothetical protein